MWRRGIGHFRRRAVQMTAWQVMFQSVEFEEEKNDLLAHVVKETIKGG